MRWHLGPLSGGFGLVGLMVGLMAGILVLSVLAAASVVYLVVMVVIEVVKAVRRHRHPEEVGVYPACPVCNNTTFGTRAGLKGHVATYHGGKVPKAPTVDIPMMPTDAEMEARWAREGL